MNKQIYLLTIHRADNYGTALQAYATQKFFSDCGFNLKILDYRCPAIEGEFGATAFMRKCAVVPYLKKNIRNTLLIKSHLRFIEFYKKFYNVVDFKKVKDNIATYVVGSDQVWNNKITGNDITYLLDFANTDSDKISFASSFGMGADEIESNYKDNCQKLLSKFKAISVREKKSVNLIKSLTGKKVDIILDPTLLIDRTSWLSIAKKIKTGPYVLIYQIGHSQSIVNIAKYISEKENIPIVSIKGSMNPLKRIDASYVWSAGPLEFLGLFANAKYVVTNSFHGTAFSINFHKRFFSEKLSTSAKGDSRVNDLLQLLGMTDRCITHGKLNVAYDTDIDFKYVDSILARERNIARTYIFNSIGGN